MRKRLNLYVLTSFLLLASCSTGTSHPLKDYVTNMNMKSDDFNVLQLTDLHYSVTTDIKLTNDYVKALVNHANPDLIVITGDSFICSSKGVVKSLFSLFESFSIPYLVLWGNHDFEGDYSVNWLNNYLSSQYYAINNVLDDDIDGYTNQVININKENKTIYQIYGLDSGRNIYQKGDGYCYDYIRDSQVDWYKKQCEDVKAKEGVAVPNIAFAHIPLWEYVYRYYEMDNSRTGSILGSIDETGTFDVKGLTDDNDGVPFWPGGVHSRFFEVGKENNLRAFFAGHDHSNDWVDSYQGVTLGYGVKSSREQYYSSKNDSRSYDKLGGSIVSINKDQSYQIEHFYLDYESLDSGYFTIISEKSEVLK